MDRGDTHVQGCLQRMLYHDNMASEPDWQEAVDRTHRYGKTKTSRGMGSEIRHEPEDSRPQDSRPLQR
jgi:hypothetical protein